MAETNPGRVTAKDPALKLAHRRLTVLELAETLRSASAFDRLEVLILDDLSPDIPRPGGPPQPVAEPAASRPQPAGGAP